MVEYNVSGGVTFAGSRILMPVAVATVLSSGLTPVSGTVVTIGTIYQGYLRTTPIGNQALGAGASGATLTAKGLQDLVVDMVVGTIVAGSVQAVVRGMEPVTGVPTSTVAAGTWLTGTVQQGSRVTVLGPLGENVIIYATVTGSVLNVTLTAEQSATS